MVEENLARMMVPFEFLGSDQTRFKEEHCPTFRNSCPLRRLMMQKATATCQSKDATH